jgi:hypothetical protein
MRVIRKRLQAAQDASIAGRRVMRDKTKLIPNEQD